MPSEQTPQESAAAAMAERRRERALALRACRPIERAFLRQLPKSRYEPYSAGEALGISSRTVWLMTKRPRVKRAMEVFLQDALEDIGVSHASLVADLVTIKEHCIRHLVTEPKAAAGAVAAIKELTELLRIAPVKRIELTGANGGPIETFATHISADMDPEEAARVYQEIIHCTH